MASCNVSVILPHGSRYSDTANPGAIELSVRDFAQQSRYSGDMVVLGNPIQKPYDAGRFLPLADKVVRKRSIWYQLIKNKISSLKPKVVQVQQHPPTAAYLKRKFPKLPVLLHIHDTQVPSFFVKAFFRWRAMRKADAIITNSTFTKEHLCKVAGVSEERVRVVYNALRPPLSPVLPKNTRKIVCVAGMMERKGAHLFLEAVIPLLKTYPDWKAVFICWEAGSTSDAYRKTIYNLLEKAPQNLIHLGHIPHAHVLSHFADAEISVVPSQIREGFGRTALEAAFHGSAIVSSGCGALKEVTGHYALYPDLQTSEAYRSCMERLITQDNFRQRRQQAVYDYAKDRFSLNKMADCYDDIIAAAIAGRTLPYSWQDKP